MVEKRKGPGLAERMQPLRSGTRNQLAPDHTCDVNLETLNAQQWN